MDSSFVAMTENRPKARWPQIPCASCEGGRLQFSSEDHFLSAEAENVMREYGAGRSGATELSGQFSGVLICGDRSCAGKTAVAGDWTYSYSDDPDTDWSEGRPVPEFTEYFRVRYLAPAPALIDVPKGTPAPIAAALAEASSVFWTSSASGANLFRQAVERVLDDQGIASTTAAGGYISTAKRIEKYAIASPALADLLDATKWIGNSGSHDADLTPKEVLDGAQYLESVLRELYAAPALLARAQAVIKAKGPVR